ncbi:MAG: hypothetical protein IKJ91_04565 [Clostridia bacterium]|nr:hypothetical protein [Clostridia bacterium]
MKKSLFLLIILTLCASFFVSCGNTDAPYEIDAEKVYIDKVENLEDYVFVDNQKSNATAIMARDLIKYISEATGTQIKSVAAFKNNDYEILVGHTNRKESTDALEALKYYDFTIRRVNNKIVIQGGSEESLMEAIKLFKAQFVDAGAKALYLPKDFTYKHEYLGNDLTVDGVDIKEFKILNKTCFEEAEIAEKLRRTFDFELEVVTEESEGEHYIILDASSYVYEDYSITVENGNIHLYGSGRSIDGAIEAFSREFLKKLGENKALKSSDKLEGKIEKPELYTKEQLMSVLTKVYEDKDHIIIGEQSRGTSACIEYAIEIFEAATGEKPGIIGIDLQTFGMGILAQPEPYTISNIICDAVDYVANGGILTFSAHWENPSGNYPDEDNRYRGVLGYDNTKAGYEKAFTDLLTPGTEYNKKWMEEIDREIEFFLALKANGVPAVWRPLHEANSNWFWFSTTQAGNTLDASYIKNIWYYIYDYFAEKGIDNLLWCFAPNYSSNTEDIPGQTKMSTTYLYPGDKYCDIVGVDWYTQGNLELMDEGGYLQLTDASKKPGALTEFGATGTATNEEGRADPELYSSINVLRDLNMLRDDGYSFIYLMTWGGSWSFAQMGFGEEFMADEMTLGQADVKALFDALK